jgi:dihydroorotase-like cyclic amidohydrolase
LRFDTVIKGGTLVIPYQGLIPGDVGIREGRIAALAEAIPSAQAGAVIDARNLHVFPGFVDPHTHMGNYLPFVEDFRTETISAAAGGVTTLLALLKLDQFAPGGSYLDIIDDIEAKLAGVPSIDFSFHCHVPGMKQALEASRCHAERGLQSFKFFTAYKGRKVAAGIDDGTIFALLRHLVTAAPGALAMIHPETDEIVRVLTDDVRSSGRQGLAAWDEARPPLVEAQALLRIVYLVERLGCPLYVVHVSSADALDVLTAYQAKGLPVIGETCTHYLSLTTDLPGTAAKVNPPIRSRSHVEALWRGIQAGALTCLGSDHGAKPFSMKGDDIWEAVLAFPGLETSLPVVLTEASRRGVSPVKVAEIAAANPARAFGLASRKGHLAPGADADLVLVDLAADRVIRAAELHSAADFTPFEGRRVTAWPLTTILRGQVVFDRGRLVTAGTGQFLRRFPQPAGDRLVEEERGRPGARG